MADKRHRGTRMKESKELLSSEKKRWLAEMMVALVWVVMFLTYGLWLTYIIMNPSYALDEQTLRDRAPYWCDFHGMEFYRLGAGGLVGTPDVYECIDKHGEIHAFKEERK